MHAGELTFSNAPTRFSSRMLEQMLGAVVAIVLAATPNFITLSLIAAGAMDLFGTIVLIFMLSA